ncbi:MAG: deoxyribonuclease V [Planctomycetota bacterium]|jgi:deoxyribonuclease V
MKTKDIHSWKLSYSEAIELQKRLAGKVCHTGLKKRPELIAGLDCAFSSDGKRIVVAAVVLKMPDLALIETTHAVRKTEFPYIPGLLSFREAPVCIRAVEKIKSKPQLFIIDGQGIAHPRRLGLAAHLGLFFNKPTIGCAKSRLIGISEEPATEKGSFTELKDKDQIIGAVVRTRTNVKPLFVSVGNKCTLEDAVEMTLSCAVKYRLPEPTRLAHQLVSKIRLTL